MSGLRYLFAPCWLALALAGCGYYSFTGAAIPPRLTTIAVPLAEDLSVSPLTGLGELLTELLTDRFVRQTRLSLEPDEAQATAVLSARIEQYRNAPVAVSGDERAALNRVTITATVRYYDRVQETEIFRRTFTGSEEYDPVAEGLDGEAAAARTALARLADDVFTAATADW